MPGVGREVWGRALAALLLTTLVGCGDSPGPFDRLVIVGSSTAAGFQSDGIDSSTQAQAYPALLAAGAGTNLPLPLLEAPGCPAPLTAALGTPSTASSCRRTQPGIAPRNLAIPHATVPELLELPSGPAGQVQAALLGARTQLAALDAARPTFAIVHAGDADVLDAALTGLPSRLTSLAEFVRSYTLIAEAVADEPSLQGALLVGIADPTLHTPALEPGAYFYLARNPVTGSYAGKPVNANCSPVTALGTPNPLSANLVSVRILLDSGRPEINCDPAYAPDSPYLLSPAERSTIRDRVLAFNQAIAFEAEARGWAFLDPNPALGACLTERDASSRYPCMRRCQDLPSATTPAQFQAAVLNSCPVGAALSPSMEPYAAPNFYGRAFSLDGTFPSQEGQAALAGDAAAIVNATYGMALPTSY